MSFANLYDRYLSLMSLYSYIKPQRDQGRAIIGGRCLSVYSYIKPQHTQYVLITNPRCLSVYSYIKPQRIVNGTKIQESCLSVYSYIKPQLSTMHIFLNFVVYLSIPTSNHNIGNLFPYITGIYIPFLTYEVDIDEVIRCKNTKKILIEEAQMELFSPFLYPKSLLCHHTVCPSHSEYSPFLSQEQ